MSMPLFHFVPAYPSYSLWPQVHSLRLCLFLKFYLFIYLFLYLWLCWVFVSVRGLSPVVASGGHSSSRCAGLSLSRPLLLWSTGSRRAGSVVVAHGPSCSTACGIFPEPVSPALAGRFSTTAPPGKPYVCVFIPVLPLCSSEPFFFLDSIYMC